MKNNNSFSTIVATLALLLLLLHDHHPPLLLTSARHVNWSQSQSSQNKLVGNWKAKRKGKGAETLEVAGSRLPDCSHACGSCSPCRLVMVSFVCASLEEAETCPMAYKCMCHNKSYPVP